MNDIPKETIIQAAQGNMDAFEQLYRAFSGFVYTIAFSITSSKADAEEVTQDVFVNAYRNLKKFRFRSSFKTWIYRVTVNTAINTSRKSFKNTNGRCDYETTLKTHSSPITATKALEEKDNETLLAVLLEQLSPEQRACLVLREIEGLRYKEIAHILHININTVRSRLKRARTALLSFGKSEVMSHEMQKSSGIIVN